MPPENDTASPGAPAAPDILYLGRSRLHRSRANLIQTLSTVEAFEDLGLHVELWLPPWSRRVALADKVREAGIARALTVRRSALLHPRWHFWPFAVVHLRRLRSARTLYTRVPEVSRALGAFGLPHHLEIHDVEALFRGGLGARLVRLHAAGILRTLIPISRGARDRLLAAGAVPERVHVAPSGVKLDAYVRLAPFDPARLERPRIVHLGRLSPERGAAVFAALAAQPWCEVTIVGGGDARLEGARNVGVVPLTDVPSWYERSDVTLIPYQPEIGTAATMSPIKLFEALAAGRPIVASRLPTLEEVLTDGETALLVPANDTAAWLAAVERLRREPDLATRLAANARALAPQYSWSERARGIARAIGLQP